ncbi:MAG: hypothetical protein V7629_06365 [Motiliproteus sp.]
MNDPQISADLLQFFGLEVPNLSGPPVRFEYTGEGGDLLRFGTINGVIEREVQSEFLYLFDNFFDCKILVIRSTN